MQKADPVDYNVIPTFLETVNYILMQPGGNHHYRPYSHDRCGPCSVKYDAIIKMESFNADSEFIIKTRNLTPISGQNLHQRSTVDRYEDVNDDYEKVLENIKDKNDKFEIYKYFYSQISEDHIRKLKLLYENDFSLFGYSFDNDFPISLD